MDKKPSTLLDHIDLLSEKGFLHSDFKPSYQLGWWLKEFEEQFELARYQAHADDVTIKFPIELKGNFNSHLDTVKFQFIYKYEPETESLHLTFVMARLDKINKPYILKDSSQLKEAEMIYKTLSNRPAYKYSNKRFDRIERQYKPREIEGKRKEIEDDAPNLYPYKHSDRIDRHYAPRDSENDRGNIKSKGKGI